MNKSTFRRPSTSIALRAFQELAQRVAGRADGSFVSLPERIIGIDTNRVEHASMNAAMDEARVKHSDPNMKVHQFLALPSSAHWRTMLRESLGDVGFQFLVETSPRKLVELNQSICDQSRFVLPDFIAGVRIDHVFDRLSKTELADLGKRYSNDTHFPTPVDAPTPSGNYPGYKLCKTRIFQGLGFRALNFGGLFDTLILRQAKVSAMITEAGLTRFDMNTRCHDVAGGSIPILVRDAIIMTVTGSPPITSGQILAAGQTGTVKPARAELEGRMQIFEMYGDPADGPSVLDMNNDELIKYRDDLLKEHGATAFNKRQARNKGMANPFTRLSAAEAFQHAMRDPDAVPVAFKVAEIEHHMGQRVARVMDALCDALNLPESIRGEFNRVAGLVDPANLDIVTPWEHALVDAHAATNPWLVRRGIFSGNTTRTDAFGNRAIPDAEIPDHVSLDGIGWKDRAKAAFLFSNHPDAPRAFNGIIGAEPARIGMLIDLLNRPEIGRALDDAPPAARKALNDFAGRLAVAAERYAPDRAGDVPRF